MADDKRDLPQNLDAERAILGAMLMKSGAVIPTVQEILNEEDFYNPPHRIVYRAITDLHSRGIAADIVTLTEYLRKNEQLDKVGGPLFILSLGDVVATTANVKYHSKIVKEKATLRRLIEAGEQIAGEAYENRQELEKILDDAEQKIFSITARETTGEFEHIKPIINRTFDQLSWILENGGHIGISTNFFELDKVISGLQKSDLILIAARPSMGKTAFALNLAENISLGEPMRLKPFEERKSVAIFSLEMSKEQLGRRLLSSHSGIEAQRLNNGQIGRYDWSKLVKAAAEIESAKLYIDDTPGLTVSEVRSRARRLKLEHEIDLVIIDYLQLMQGRQTRITESNRQQEISEISRSLKGLARELDVPIIALSQLSRAVEMRAEKKPQLSDLRESGSLEQDADIVMFLYREDYYKPDTENKNITELIIAKHRNGPTGTIKLQFDRDFIRFRNPDFIRQEE